MDGGRLGIVRLPTRLECAFIIVGLAGYDRVTPFSIVAGLSLPKQNSGGIIAIQQLYSMNPSLTIVLAQMNATVGDVAANTEKIIALARKAKAEHTADLVLFPELAITGYPPEDLLLRREFLEQVDRHLEKIQAQTPEIAVLVGHPSRESTGLCNSASLYAGGARLITYHKQL